MVEMSTGSPWFPSGPPGPFGNPAAAQGARPLHAQPDQAQQQDLAVALKELTSRYDNLFECSFYSMAGTLHRQIGLP